MSIEHAEALIRRIKTDKSFADQLLANESVDDRIAYAVKAGFDCSRQDIDLLAKTSTQTQHNEQPKRVCQSCIIGYK